MPTRNTHCYKIEFEGREFFYRDLTASELSFVDNIKNPVYRNEMACRLSLVDKDYDRLSWQAKQAIGEDIFKRSVAIIKDGDLFNITINAFRKSTPEDPVLGMISFIVRVLPNTSTEYLLNLTYADLIELTCLCEHISNKHFFSSSEGSPKVHTGHVGKTGQTVATGHGLAKNKNGKLEFADDGMPLAEKIKQNQEYFKTK